MIKKFKDINNMPIALLHLIRFSFKYNIIDFESKRIGSTSIQYFYKVVRTKDIDKIIGSNKIIVKKYDCNKFLPEECKKKILKKEIFSVLYCFKSMPSKKILEWSKGKGFVNNEKLSVIKIKNDGRYKYLLRRNGDGAILIPVTENKFDLTGLEYEILGFDGEK